MIILVPHPVGTLPNGPGPFTMTPEQTLVQRLEAAGLSTTRWIDIPDGGKGAFDHTQHKPEAVSGNYGVYAEATDQLVLLDVDDYEDVEDTSGLTALATLPPTFQTKSPHGGTHHYYRVEVSADGRLPAAMLEDAFGTQNPKPSWGEVRCANQYVVGPGSQLDGCDKDWCEDCAEPDGGVYGVREDTDIASISAEDLREALRADPNLTTDRDGDTDTAPAEVPEPDADEEEILEHALESNESFRRLWNGDFSEYGGDRSEAESALAAHLAFWFQGRRETVRRMMDRADTKKWGVERTDDSYYDSVLSAVDEVGDYYDPSRSGGSDPADFDPDELERAEAILRSQTAPDEPAGDLKEKNGCYGYENVRYDDDGNVAEREWQTVTTFTLKTKRYLQTFDGEVLTVEVRPKHPQEEPYEVDVEPADFNEPRTFRNTVVVGRTTRFEPQARSTQQILGELRQTVGSQPAPRQEATEFIGLHAGGDEWVSPAGTLTAEGWADDPEHTHFEKGGSGDGETDSSLAEKWQLLPDQGDDYDADEVREILERVPRLRRPSRGLPILGWFYAAPLKTYIQEWEGQFNLLQVTGGTGAGKTNSIGAYQQLFGGNSEPYGCGDTRFTIQKKLSSSCGFPVWFDEYKPADLSERQLDWLHRQFRKLTAEQAVSKGRSDLSELTFKMRAPTVFSGEQWVQDAAARRRAIMTNLPQPGEEQRRVFSQLVGKSYEDSDGETRYPAGLDLHEHALAYYRFILDLDGDTLRQVWHEARDRTADRLRDLRAGNIEDTEFQGLQTIEFGVAIWRRFAREHGVEADALVTDADLRAAFEHVVENIGPGGRRREHIDEYLELVTQAANAGYLQEGVHHRVLDSQKFGGQALALHWPSVFAQVKRYVGDHNLDDYTLLGKADYLDTLRDKADADGTYALDVNRRVRGLENGSKAVFIDPGVAADVLDDDFHLAAFTAVDEDDETGSGLANIDPSAEQVTVTARVAALLDPPPYLDSEGTLEGKRAMLDFIGRGDGVGDELEEGRTYRFVDAIPGTDQDGSLQLELRRGVTKIEAVDTEAEDQTSLDDEAVADGGAASLKERVHRVVQRADEPISATAVAAELTEDPETVEERLQALEDDGRITPDPSGGYVGGDA